MQFGQERNCADSAFYVTDRKFQLGKDVSTVSNCRYVVVHFIPGFAFFFPKLCNSCKKEILQFLLVVSLRKILLRQIYLNQMQAFTFYENFSFCIID